MQQTTETQKMIDMGKRIANLRERLDLSQEQLAELVGVSQGSIWKWETGQVQYIRPINKLADILKTSVNFLETGDLSDTQMSQKVTDLTQLGIHRIKAPHTDKSIMESRGTVPVYGPVSAGDPQRILLTEEYVIEDMDTPDELVRVKGGFVMRVAGDSMRPKYRPNQLVSVHPNKQPTVIEEDCVVVFKEDGNALIKEFAGETETEWKLRQHNPPKLMKVKKSDVRAIYSIVGRPSP